MMPEAIQPKVDWINEVKAQDFHFWRRWRGQPNQTAFRQPQTWCNPMILVDGGVSQPFFPNAVIRGILPGRPTDDAETVAPE